MVNYDGLYNKEYFGDKLVENRLSERRLNFQIVEKGTILPFRYIDINGRLMAMGGVLDSFGNFIENTSVHEGIGGSYNTGEKISERPETVIFLGTFNHVWGHCLTDHVKRIWFLESEVYKKYFFDCDIVCGIMGGGIITNFVKLLKIVGVDVQKLKLITRPTKFKNVILPDPSFYGKSSPYTVFTKEYIQFTEKVKNFSRKHLTPLSDKKFYFYHGAKQIGEERLANYFHSKGYAVVQPEKLPLETQLNILANCESFVSTVGSISHNTIFLKDKTEAILIPRFDNLNSFQIALNQINDINVFYIDSSISIFTKGMHEGIFCYILSENLRKHFGDEITEKYTDEDFATFLAYVHYSKSQGLNENPQVREYLKNIFPEFMEQLKTRKELLQKFGIVIK